MGLRDPVAERRAQRLREHYCHPIKDLDLPRTHRSDQITVPLGLGGGFAQPRHRNGVAAGLAQCSRQDLYDPEYKGYLWYLSNELRCLFVYLVQNSRII